VAQRGDAADDEPGAFSYKIGVRFFDLLADEVAQFLFVHPVRAAGNDQDGFAALPAFEDERLGDLPDFTTNGLGRFGGGARRLLVFDDLVGEAASG